MKKTATHTLLLKYPGEKTERHAFLIMAHSNWYTLEKLLQSLDAPWADIYLHIDKKAKDFDRAHVMGICEYSPIYMVKRRKVSWGNESQIKAEMELFKASFRRGPYRYYHFMSGSDFPLKSAEEIYGYFSSIQDNFIQILPAAPYTWRLATYINVFRQAWIPASIRRCLNVCSEIIQYKLHINRMKWLSNRYPRIGKGHNWCDLTQAAVEELVKKESDIRHFTRFTHCSDEMYKQIVLMNNDALSKTISQIDIRKINWVEGESHPQTFTVDDYDELIESKECVFARKFDEKTDRQIIDKLYERIKNNVAK